MSMTALVIVLALPSCSDDDEVASVTAAIYPTSVELVVPGDLANTVYYDDSGTKVLPMMAGTNATLTYTVTPDSATFDDVVWSSTDETVATVDENGTVFALSGSGRGYTVIQVAPDPFYSGSGIYATIKVIVADEVNYVTSIDVTADDTYVYSGSTLQLTATVYPDDATFQTVTWSSQDESIATVDSDGLVTGVSPGTVTIVATAMDGSQKIGSIDITVVESIEPQSVTIDQKYSSDNGYACAINEGYLALEFTTVPSISTSDLIEWTSSDESLATVDAGVVTFNDDAEFGEFTVTATCPATGNSSSITLNLAEGLYRELFHDEDNYGWSDAGQSGNDTETSTEWSYGMITITTYTQSETAQRGDLKCQDVPVYLHAGTYPIFAIKMDDVKDLYTSVTARNITLDASGTCDGETYKGGLDGNNNKWLYDYVCSDGSHVFIYDLSTQEWATGGVLPSSLATFTTLQFKYADIKTVTSQITYNVYWIQTFQSLEDVAEYIESEGLTYEEN